MSVSLRHSIAGFYWFDARDFAKRFDLLWEEHLLKSGRIKSFVDLLMGCECALKAHVFLSKSTSDLAGLYKQVRFAGHDCQKLANMASFLVDREVYDRVGSKLAPFSVLIRYSLDSHATFFPTATAWLDSPIPYRLTISDNAWVLAIRQDLERLIDSCSSEFTGEVSDDVGAIIENDLQLEDFIRRNVRLKRVT